MKKDLIKHIKSFMGDSVYYDPYGGGTSGVNLTRC